MLYKVSNDEQSIKKLLVDLKKIYGNYTVIMRLFLILTENTEYVFFCIAV